MNDRLEMRDRLLILKKPFDIIEVRQMANALSVKWQMAWKAALTTDAIEKEIEDRVRQLSIMSHQLHYDALTDLPNAVLLEDRLTKAIAAAIRHHKQIVIMFIELDRFSQINSTFGYSFGDELLKQIAGRMFSLSASIGISIYPGDGEDVHNLIKKAEMAMHEVKSTDSDGFRFFKSDMNLQASKRQMIEQELCQALNDNAFILHYQPKLNLASGAITGAEALVRCQRPNGEIMQPAQFIGIAEESGLIIPISRWVLLEACQQARTWEAKGHPKISIAVNISAAEFRQKGFLESVRSILQETGLEAHRLTLEISEAAIMQHIESTLPVLRVLKEMGVGLTIDNFGQSLSTSRDTLQTLPVDALNIDASLVSTITTNPASTAMISKIIGMGNGYAAAGHCGVAANVLDNQTLDQPA